MGRMTIEKLHDIFDALPENTIPEWVGTCRKCGCKVKVEALPTPEGIAVNGGALFLNDDNEFQVLCEECWESHGKTEVYTRCVGYLRPVAQMHEGKREEVKDRKMFNLASELPDDKPIVMHPDDELCGEEE